MKLSSKVKKSISNTTLTFEDLERWNAFRGLQASRKRLKLFQSAQQERKMMNLKSPKDFRKWAGFEKRTSGTVYEVLHWGINPHFILWTVLRVELLPAKYLHYLANFFCRDFHTRLAKEGTYIDYKYGPMLAVKEEWADGKLSLGNLAYQQRKASQLLADIHDSKDEKMIAAAAALHATLDEDPRAALLNLFFIINSIFSLKKENKFRLETIKDDII